MGLDGVELVMAWEESFGISITDTDAGKLLTPRMATDLIYDKLTTAAMPGPGGCLTQRAFHRLRSALQTAFDIPSVLIRPDALLGGLFPLGTRRERWQILQAHVGVNSFPKMFFGMLPYGCGTVGSLARSLAARQPNFFRRANEPWTRPQVRAVVREIIVEQLGIPEFSDDDEFARDLRVG